MIVPTHASGSTTFSKTSPGSKTGLSLSSTAAFTKALAAAICCLEPARVTMQRSCAPSTAATSTRACDASWMPRMTVPPLPRMTPTWHASSKISEFEASAKRPLMASTAAATWSFVPETTTAAGPLLRRCASTRAPVEAWRALIVDPPLPMIVAISPAWANSSVSVASAVTSTPETAARTSLRALSTASRPPFKVTAVGLAPPSLEVSSLQPEADSMNLMVAPDAPMTKAILSPH
mmetsp:Transcript_6730/g.21710  ORF Transcript_6730/g.21710 Transcript_6730/m.21710 type:complete len:235 (-) Transcript_6730:850-1554(-)